MPNRRLGKPHLDDPRATWTGQPACRPLRVGAYAGGTGTTGGDGPAKPGGGAAGPRATTFAPSLASMQGPGGGRATGLAYKRKGYLRHFRGKYFKWLEGGAR